jgi:hypothetical protein
VSSHPNVILQLTLQPQDLPRKTMRAILQDAGVDPDEESPRVNIGDDAYHVRLMEDSYNEDFQIGAPEGSIVLDQFLTYGYGEKLEWSKAAEKYERLKAWAEVACAKHSCTVHEIVVTANYW